MEQGASLSPLGTVADQPLKPLLTELSRQEGPTCDTSKVNKKPILEIELLTGHPQEP